MDPSGSADSKTETSSPYFARTILEDHKMTLFTKNVFWLQMEDKLSGDSNHPEAVETFERLYIKEEKFNKKKALVFWKWISKLTKAGGHLVRELTLELFESENLDVFEAIAEIKVPFVMSMVDLFPKLEALKILGRGFDLSKWPEEQKMQFLMVMKHSKRMNLQCLHVDRDVTEEHSHSVEGHPIMGWHTLTYRGAICPFVQLGIGAEKLTELSIFLDQIYCEGADDIVFPHVTTLYFGGFGGSTTSDPDFVNFFNRTFPAVRKLFFRDMTPDRVDNVINFIATITDTRQLEVFGVDHPYHTYENRKKQKISRVPVIQLDMKLCINSVKVDILEHVENVSQVVLLNWDQCRMARDRLIDAVTVRVPPSCGIKLVSSEGVVEDGRVADLEQKMKKKLSV